MATSTALQLCVARAQWVQYRGSPVEDSGGRPKIFSISLPWPLQRRATPAKMKRACQALMQIYGHCFRASFADFGSEGGQLPDVGLLAFLFADRHDLCAVMTDYVLDDRKLRTSAVRAFTALQQRALPGAQRRNKRRGRTDLASQKVALARRLDPADDSAGALDTVSWLFKRSGARRRQSAWCC